MLLQSTLAMNILAEENTACTYYSMNPDVLTVDEDGVITAVGGGLGSVYGVLYVVDPDTGERDYNYGVNEFIYTIRVAKDTRVANYEDSPRDKTVSNPH